MVRDRIAVMFVALLIVGLVQGTATGGPPTCFGKRATITGGGSDDVLTGTPGDDVIVARGGKDVVRGLRGNDLICGGRGADKISGGPGDDKLSGGGVVGEDDVVTFKGASGGVHIDLGTGTATGQGSDVLKDFEFAVGSSGNDVISGDPDLRWENLYGGGGRDTLHARSKQSSLFGERGADKLIGGRGDDDFYGGRGDDTIDGSGGDGAGFDSLVYWNARRAVRVQAATRRVTGEGTDTFTDVDVIFGSHFGDTMLGANGRDVFNGDQGNDTLRGAGGNDWLDGDTGDDRVFGGPGNDFLAGREGHDLLDGEAGTDECVSGEDVRACE